MVSGAQMILQWCYITLAGMSATAAVMLVAALVHGALTHKRRG